MKRTILHSDLNAFYASVEMMLDQIGRASCRERVLVVV